MSGDFKSQAKQVKRDAAIARHNWDPDPSSWHFRMYKWWQRKSAHYNSRDNFCHYWRVVLIWAPLVWLAPIICVVGCLAAIALLIAVFFLAPEGRGSLLILAGIVYVVIGCMIGGESVKKFSLTGKPNVQRGLVELFFLPVVIVVFALFGLIWPLRNLFVGLHTRYDFYNRARRWFFGASLRSSGLLNWVRPVNVLAVALIALFGVYEPRSLLVITGVILLCASIVSLLYLADRTVEKRRETAKSSSVTTKPSNVRRVFYGMTGIFALIWSAILAAKWKICPIIKLPER